MILAWTDEVTGKMGRRGWTLRGISETEWIGTCRVVLKGGKSKGMESQVTTGFWSGCRVAPFPDMDKGDPVFDLGHSAFKRPFRYPRGGVT